MTGRFDRPGLLATVTRAAVLDGTPQVIMNAVTHATARRRPGREQVRPPDDVRRLPVVAAPVVAGPVAAGPSAATG